MRQMTDHRYVLGWSITAALSVALMGFGLVPGYASNLWLVYISLVIVGVFLDTVGAVALGTGVFVAVACWLAWKYLNSPVQPYETLFLFLAPLAPLPLSALRQVLKEPKSPRRAFGVHGVFEDDSAKSGDTPTAIRRLIKPGVAVRLMNVEIQNSAAVRKLLGDQAWRDKQILLRETLAKAVGEDGCVYEGVGSTFYTLAIVAPNSGLEACVTRVRSAVDQLKGLKFSVTMIPASPRHPPEEHAYQYTEPAQRAG